jgi:hypothetical protein
MQSYINVYVLKHNLIAFDGLKYILIDLNNEFKCQTILNNEGDELLYNPKEKNKLLSKHLDNII